MRIFYGPTAEHDEVIAFLSGVMNTIPDQIASGGHPRHGEYLIKTQILKKLGRDFDLGQF